MPQNKIVVQVGGDASQLQGTIDQLTKLGLIDEKNADTFKKNQAKIKKQLEETEKTADKVGEAFDEMGKKMIAAFAIERVAEKAFDAIKEYVQESIEVFEEAEQTLNRLKLSVTNVMKGNTEEFNKMRESAERLAKSMNLLYTPEQIMKAQTMLANAKLSREQIEKTIPVILNMAAASGKSIDEISEKFITVAEKGGLALKDFGIRVKDTHNSTDNLNMALSRAGAYAGDMTAALDTYANAAQRTKNINEEFQKSLGEKLAPMWENFKHGTLEFVADLTGFNTELLASLDKIKGHIVETAESQKKGFMSVFSKESTNQLEKQLELIEGTAKAQGKLKIAEGDLYAARERNNRISSGVETGKTEDISPLEKKVELLRNEKETLADLLKVRKETDNKTKESNRDLTKFTEAQLETRLKSLQDESADEILYEGQTTGILKDAQRDYEKTRTQEALTKLRERNLKMKDENSKLLKELQDQEITTLNETLQLQIDLEDSDYKKKLKTLDLQLQKQTEEYEKRNKKIEEGLKSSDERIRLQAKKDKDLLISDAKLYDEKYWRERQILEDAKSREKHIRDLADQKYFAEIEIAAMEGRLKLTEMESKISENKAINSHKKESELHKIRMDNIQSEYKAVVNLNRAEQTNVNILARKTGEAIKDQQSKILKQMRESKDENGNPLQGVRENADKYEELIKSKADGLTKFLKDHKVTEWEELSDIEKEGFNNIITLMDVEMKQLEKQAVDAGDEQVKKTVDTTKSLYKEWYDYINKQNLLATKNLLSETEMNLKKEEEQKRHSEVMIKKVQEMNQAIITATEQRLDSVIQSDQTQIDEQQKIIDTQRVLAEKGLSNDLAFEQKRQDQMAQQKIKDEIKLKKTKELEIFLNALAKFTEDNPKTALAKAIGLVAASKVVEAVYAEEGGIIGQSTQTSRVGFGGFSRRHKSGNDVLLHAEKGEGILSVKEMNNLGYENFNSLKSLLKAPLNVRSLPTASVVVNDNREIVSRLESLERTIRDKKEVSIDFDGMNNMIHTTIEHGIKNVVREQFKKSRL